MRVLLDTHAFLFWVFNAPELSAKARGLLADQSNEILVSSVSAWEIATKYRLGKLPSAHVLVTDISGWVQKAGFHELAMTIAHAQRAGTWPQAHRDPFDRMLAAQSAIEAVSLVTRDSAFDAFPVDVLW
ncbi:MAG: type II toxin-antitoxin system VapC family toxin [Deltaproteobacteria bacterium]|nr:type II toxin-antitoxin system VapC family toxin [Deltaproteobacteria bacterium]